ncbi:hypothetical protein [Jiulongibacter sp. NS-SX5]|uniref:hypothetical protein n=1 Tax=Jiulongibacter sp. NS-SX5 TaxID=3463854 RepID=UPI004058EEE3
MKKLFAVIVLSLFFVGTTNAQYPVNRSQARNGYSKNYSKGYTTARSARGVAGKINVMQREARERIADGIVRGTINSSEAARLLSVAERIEMKENRMLRNGRMTNNEFRELENDLIKLNRMIKRNNRDNDRAPVDNFGRYGRRY